MQPDPSFVADEQSSPAYPTWFIALLGSCVVVLTMYALGSSWIAEASLGIPVGVWVVLLVTGVTGLASRTQSLIKPHAWAPPPAGSQASSQSTTTTAPAPTTAVGAPTSPKASAQSLISARVPALSLVRDLPESPGVAETTRVAPAAVTETASPARTPSPLPRTLPRTLARTRIRETWPHGLPGLATRLMMQGAAASADMLGVLPASTVSAWLDRAPRPTKKFRIGLLAIDRVGVFADTRSSDTDVVSIDDGEPAAALEAHGLDVVVSRNEQGFVVTCREREKLDAAWFDWGSTRPVSYFSVFPLRLDPKLVSIAGNPTNPAVTFWLARAAAAAARHHGRINVYDRLRGRTPTTLSHGGGLDPLSGILLDLARDLDQATPGTPEGTVAARVASAFLGTASPALPLAERGVLIERAAVLAPDEPEILLRLAAVRFAMLNDSLGMDALLRAERLLRVSPTLQPTGVLPLIEAELEHGAFGEMTVGRVAAGICLSAATTSPDRLTYLREDLFEDLRFSAWLVGRDPEHALLMDAFRQLERQRRADLMGLPEATAQAPRKRTRKKKAA